MKALLKSTALAVGLSMGAAAAAYAQSVSSLPPANAEPATTDTTPAPPPVSTAKIYPNPGNNGSWKEDHYQKVESDNDPSRHPYSTPHFGPAPN